MDYNVNPCLWKSIFPVPTQIVDEHIRLAGAVQLKALMWILRYSSQETSMEKMSFALGISTADLTDALQYWIDKNILIKNGENIILKEENIVSKEEPVDDKNEQKSEMPVTENVATSKTLPDIEIAKPTIEQIATRGEESPEIRFMFGEVQKKLGKTIGFDGQSTLLVLHDHYGLPVEVVLMIIEYCVCVGKTSFSYIAKLGKDWAEKEIDTIEKADEHITALNTSNRLWLSLKNRAGFVNTWPTKSQSEYLKKWEKDFGFDVDMIYLAYEEMANHTQKLSFPYINKVLENWHKNSLNTPEAVENSKKAGKENPAKNFAKKDDNASYDVNEFKKKVMKKPLVYKKKEGDS